MAPHLKPSEGLVTASEYNVFFLARLKLTGIYVLILAVILLGFSLLLYQSVQHNLTDASEDDFAGIESHHHFVQNTLASVQNEIILIDLIILVAAAGVSYVLAGYTLKPIQRSVEAQKAFSENASHELRTPLAVMKNDAEVLLRNPNPTKDLVHTTLHSNIEEIDRMTKMAEDLLMLARSENRTIPAMEKIEITEVARSVAGKMYPLAEKKGVNIKISSGTPLYIEGNKAGLERVFINLLQNAVEHTSKNGSIVIEILQEKSQSVIKISDSGSGIAEKDLPHIFKRFYKGDGASGSGLGLSIVKELIDQHGGSVSIESTKGKGTSIAIRLPLLV